MPSSFCIIDESSIQICLIFPHLDLDWCWIVRDFLMSYMVEKYNNSNGKSNTVADFQLGDTILFHSRDLLIKLCKNICHTHVIVKCHDRKSRSKENQYT